MKKASRFMPKYKEESGNIWLFILFMIVIFGFLAWAMWEVPYLILCVPAFFLIDAWDKKKRVRHFQQLLDERDDDSICTFSHYFDCNKVDTWIIRAVYEQLQNYLKSEKEHFPLRATDDVFVDLLIDEEDFEFDLIEEIAQRTGRSLDNVESNPYFGNASRVENLVYLFNEQPMKAT
jgi:hypothetical protein